MKFEDTYGFGRFEFSPDDSLFFTIDGQNLQVWQSANQSQKYSLKGNFVEAAFSPNGKRLAGVLKNSILILDCETGKTETITENYKKGFRFLGWNPNGEDFAVKTEDFKIDILNVKTNKVKNSLVAHEKKKSLLGKFFDTAFCYGEFSPDGEKILTICDDPTAKLWDVETGKIVHTFEHPLAVPYQGASPAAQEIVMGDMSPDGKWILTRTYNESRLWNFETGELVKEIAGYSFPSFSPDGLCLGLFNEPLIKERAVSILNLKTMETKTILPKYHGNIVSWSYDGKKIITDRTTDERSKDLASIWDVESGTQKASLKTYSKNCFDPVSTCRSDFNIFRFSPDDKIITVQNKKGVKFLNPENGEEIFTTDEIQSPVHWSANGKFLLSKGKEKGKLILSEVRY